VAHVESSLAEGGCGWRLGVVGAAVRAFPWIGWEEEWEIGKKRMRKIGEGGG
jgi:hypothetical protein